MAKKSQRSTKGKTKPPEDSEIDTAVGARIKAVRERRGIKLSQLATLSGISKMVISRTEAGLTEPSLRTLKQLANALDVSIADLVADKSREEQGHTFGLALVRVELAHHVDELKRLLRQAESILSGLDSIPNPPPHAIPLNPSPSEPSKLEEPVFPRQLELD